MNVGHLDAHIELYVEFRAKKKFFFLTDAHFMHCQRDTMTDKHKVPPPILQSPIDNPPPGIILNHNIFSSEANSCLVRFQSNSSPAQRITTDTSTPQCTFIGTVFRVGSYTAFGCASNTVVIALYCVLHGAQAPHPNPPYGPSRVPPERWHPELTRPPSSSPTGSPFYSHFTIRGSSSPLFYLLSCIYGKLALCDRRVGCSQFLKEMI